MEKRVKKCLCAILQEPLEEFVKNPLELFTRQSLQEFLREFLDFFLNKKIASIFITFFEEISRLISKKKVKKSVEDLPKESPRRFWNESMEKFQWKPESSTEISKEKSHFNSRVTSERNIRHILKEIPKAIHFRFPGKVFWKKSVGDFLNEFLEKSLENSLENFLKQFQRNFLK